MFAGYFFVADYGSFARTSLRSLFDFQNYQQFYPPPVLNHPPTSMGLECLPIDSPSIVGGWATRLKTMSQVNLDSISQKKTGG